MRVVLLATVLLAGCAAEEVAAPAPQGPLELRMASAGIGDLVVADGWLRFDDGSEVPIQRVADGVYAVPSRPSRTPAGADICAGRPAGYFTLHRTADGLYAMNWGDWVEVPEPPAADALAAPGACATFSYRAD